MDLFLHVNIWVEIAKAHAFSAAIRDPLGYETAIHSWQYRKPLAGIEHRNVKLDMMARHPLPDEPVKVKGNPRQVGREMGTGISARETREAFAIDDSPLLLTFPFRGKEYSVLVPHPYAWLNMKMRAAYDLLMEQRGLVVEKLTTQEDRVRLKHVYDVYVLIAILTREELAQSAALAAKYLDHGEAAKTREQAVELYGNKNAVGIQMVEAYARRYMGDDLIIDHALFWRDGLKVALGITDNAYTVL